MSIELKLISANCSGSFGTVTLEASASKLSDAIEALQAAPARQMALLEATKAGIAGSPGISGTRDAVYPVNSEGQAIDDTLKMSNGEDFPAAAPERQPHAYRVTYNITAR